MRNVIYTQYIYIHIPTHLHIYIHIHPFFREEFSVWMRLFKSGAAKNDLAKSHHQAAPPPGLVSCVGTKLFSRVKRSADHLTMPGPNRLDRPLSSLQAAGGRCHQLAELHVGGIEWHGRKVLWLIGGRFQCDCLMWSISMKLSKNNQSKSFNILNPKKLPTLEALYGPFLVILRVV